MDTRRGGRAAGRSRVAAALLTRGASGLFVFLSLQAPWLRSGPGRCEAPAARARLIGVKPARGPGPRGARSGQCGAGHGRGSREGMGRVGLGAACRLERRVRRC